MKQFLLILICFVSVSNMSAQYWQQDVRWLYEQYSMVSEGHYLELEKINDTIIDSRNCINVKQTRYDVIGSNLTEHVDYNIILEYVNNRVNYQYPGDGQFHQLYDFNLGVGDTLATYCPYVNESPYLLLIDSITIINLGGLDRKVQHVTSIAELNDELVECEMFGPIIEGIGDLEYIRANYSVVDPPVGGQLLCYTEQAENYPDGDNCEIILDTEFIPSTKISIYPNPTTGIISINYDQEAQVMIYNISGQIVARFNSSKLVDISKLKSGIYYLELRDDSDRIYRHKIVKTR